MQSQQCDFVSLMRSLQSGDATSFPALMKLLAPMVERTIAPFRRMERDGWLLDDLRQEAWTAVWLAVDKYDVERYPKLNRPFFSHAVFSRLTAQEEKSSAVRITRNLSRFLKNADLANVDFEKTDDEIAKAYPGVSAEDVAFARQEGRRHWTVRRIDMALFDPRLSGNRCTGQLACSSVDLEDPEDVDAKLDLMTFLKSFLAQLSESEQELFVLRFIRGVSRVESAIQLSCSAATLRRTETALLSKCGAAWEEYESLFSESERQAL